MITYNDIVKHYKKYKSADTWITHCQNTKDLEETIRRAASAEDKDKNRNPHQYRLKADNLSNFGKALQEKFQKIKNTKDFDKLWNIVNEVGKNTYGIGELAVYDTTIRIGQCLKTKLEPKSIYLHAGTRIGAWNLFNKKRLGRSIGMPSEFKNHKLKCWEVEEILCIYKDCFNCIRLKNCNKIKCELVNKSIC
jgi:hypothetical protein